VLEVVLFGDPFAAFGIVECSLEWLGKIW
jgi:hypothetical protein